MALCEPVKNDVRDPNGRETAGELLDLPPGVPPLYSFYLYLTSGCNLACRHCWITPTFIKGKPAPGECLSPALLRSAVREAKPLGLRRAKLTGGEPLLNPHFGEIVELLTYEGIGMDMETNGTLIDAPLARYLKQETNVSFISISLDGAKPATHDHFRGVEGAFAGALDGLGYLVDAGYDNVQIIMSLHRGNIGELDELVELAAERGAGSVKLNPVMPSGRGVGMHQRGEALDYEEVMALAHYALTDLQRNSPISLKIMLPPALMTVGELRRAGAAGGSCQVRHILGVLGSGEMALCGIGRNVPELCFGKLGVDSIRDVWSQHPVLLGLRRDLDEVDDYPGICGDCIHAARCLTFCVAQNYLDAGRLVWPSSLCAEAERRGEFPATRRRGQNR